MNANKIIDDSMSLDEKLKAIEEMLLLKKQELAKVSISSKNYTAPEADPSDALICAGCQ